VIALLLALIAPTAHAACPNPTPSSELRGVVDDALLSFATLDEEGFLAASDAARNGLPCASELLTAAEAAGLHRISALRAFWDGDEAVATASFQAALRLEPDHRLSDKIAPEGGPLARLYAGAAARPAGLMVPFRAPSWTTGYVDGARATERPANIPAIVQYEVAGQGVIWTDLVPPGAAIPDSQEAARAARAAYGGGAGVVPPVAVVPEPVAVVPEPVAVVPEPVAVVPEHVAVVPPEPVAVVPEPVAVVPEPVAAVEPPKTEQVPERLVEVAENPAGRGNVPTPPRPPREPREGGGKGGLVAATVATGIVSAGLFGTSVLARQSFDDAPTKGKFALTNGAYFGAVGGAALTVGLAGVTIAVK
jgi:hypothetical protein